MSIERQHRKGVSDAVPLRNASIFSSVVGGDVGLQGWSRLLGCWLVGRVLDVIQNIGELDVHLFLGSGTLRDEKQVRAKNLVPDDPSSAFAKFNILADIPFKRVHAAHCVNLRT